MLTRSNTLCLLLVFVMVVCLASSFGECQKPKLIVKASRNNGYAPLAVHFDATETTLSGKDSFRDITYSFNFGDNLCGNWSIDGKPKNTQIGGPIAAHVYDFPGNYTVWVRASAPGGYYTDVTVSIQVSDPNVFFSGTKTVCVSTSGDFTSCPSDAKRQNSLPSGTDWTLKRWLLRRGDSFGPISIQEGNSRVFIGAYGNANQPAPIVERISVGNDRPKTKNFPYEITVMDLSIPKGIGASLGKRQLYYRNNITGCENNICVLYGDPHYYMYEDPWRFVPLSDFYNPFDFYFVDNTVIGNILNSDYNFYGSIAKSAFMGNYVKYTKYHNMRCTQCYKVFFSHNHFAGVSSSGNYHSLKLHAGAQQDNLWYNDNSTLSTVNWISQYNVISNNILSSPEDNNVWISMVSPQNGDLPERITDIIVENNKYIIHRPDQYDLLMAARNITYRANTRSDGTAAFVQFGPHGESLPASWLGPYFTTSTPVVINNSTRN